MSGSGIFTREGLRQAFKPRPRVPRQPPRPHSAPAQSASAPRVAGAAPQATGQAVTAPALLERRRELAGRFAELHWDLGGLVYEMAIRDHFRLDVLIRRAAQLQQLDGELAEVERLLRLDQAGAAGGCPSCGALHARGAVYCWQCGAGLMEKVTLAPAPVEKPAER